MRKTSSLRELSLGQADHAQPQEPRSHPGRPLKTSGSLSSEATAGLLSQRDTQPRGQIQVSGGRASGTPLRSTPKMGRQSEDDLLRTPTQNRGNNSAEHIQRRPSVNSLTGNELVVAPPGGFRRRPIERPQGQDGQDDKTATAHGQGRRQDEPRALQRQSSSNRVLLEGLKVTPKQSAVLDSALSRAERRGTVHSTPGHPLQSCLQAHYIHTCTLVSSALRLNFKLTLYRLLPLL